MSVRIQSINKHLMQFSDVRGQGGGIEELMAWCHTCDPSGVDIMTTDVYLFGMKLARIDLKLKTLKHVRGQARVWR